MKTIRMHRRTQAALVGALCGGFAAISGLPAHAQGAPSEAMPEPRAGAPTTIDESRDTVRASGTITAIDKNKQTVTVKGEDGKNHVVQASPDRVDFSKMAVGDKVRVTYQEASLLQLHKAGEVKAGASSETIGRTSGPGATPGGVAGEMTTLRAEIVSVDTRKNTITVKGPAGKHRTFDVTNPQYRAELPKLKAGQVLELTYSEAAAIEVVPAKK